MVKPNGPRWGARIFEELGHKNDSPNKIWGYWPDPNLPAAHLGSD